jgi:hypothetical protein
MFSFLLLLSVLDTLSLPSIESLMSATDGLVVRLLFCLPL